MTLFKYQNKQQVICFCVAVVMSKEKDEIGGLEN